MQITKFPFYINHFAKRDKKLMFIFTLWTYICTNDPMDINTFIFKMMSKKK